MAIDDRHRGKHGEISEKHANTLVRTLGRHYGSNFAKGVESGKAQLPPVQAG